MLLDTGLRASELCALRIGDVNMKSGRRFLWRYLAEREDGDNPDEPLFIGKFNRPMNRDALR